MVDNDQDVQRLVIVTQVRPLSNILLLLWYPGERQVFHLLMFLKIQLFFLFHLIVL